MNLILPVDGIMSGERGKPELLGCCLFIRASFSLHSSTEAITDD
jgi:hypothetical protein